MEGIDLGKDVNVRKRRMRIDNRYTVLGKVMY